MKYNDVSASSRTAISKSKQALHSFETSKSHLQTLPDLRPTGSGHPHLELSQINRPSTLSPHHLETTRIFETEDLSHSQVFFLSDTILPSVTRAKTNRNTSSSFSTPKAHGRLDTTNTAVTVGLRLTGAALAIFVLGRPVFVFLSKQARATSLEVEAGKLATEAKTGQGLQDQCPVAMWSVLSLSELSSAATPCTSSSAESKKKVSGQC